MERLPDYVEYTQKGRGLTLQQIIDREDLTMLTMTQISRVMKMHPSRLNYYAKTGQLFFETQRTGNRYKVARLTFLKAMGVETEKTAGAAMTDG